MTTLDQIRLLETKVESAVAKMEQLQAENDALRNKCAELTNALESKTEQLLAFTTNKEEIEVGIKNALDRLNYIENSVLGTGSVSASGQGSIHITPGAGLSSIEPITDDKNSKEKQNSESPVVTETVIPETVAPEDKIDSEQSITTTATTETPISKNPGLSNLAPIEEIHNVGYTTEQIPTESFSKPAELAGEHNVVPNFGTMKMTQQQPESASTETSIRKNDIDEGDQDTFEYDIF